MPLCFGSALIAVVAEYPRTTMISVHQLLNPEAALLTIMRTRNAAPSVPEDEYDLIELVRHYTEVALRLYGAADGLAGLLAFVRHVDEYGQAAAWFHRFLVPEIKDTLNDMLEEGTLDDLRDQVDVDLFFGFDRWATNLHDGLDHYGDRFVVRMVDDLHDVDEIMSPERECSRRSLFTICITFLFCAEE
jgi:hypothetical protein